MNNIRKIRNYFFVILVMLCRINVNAATTVDCNSWGAAKQDLQNLFDLMKIIIPLLVIGLSMYDFIKALTSKDDKDFKKTFKTLMKRLIYAVIFFFLPVLLNLLLDIFATGADVCVG